MTKKGAIVVANERVEITRVEDFIDKAIAAGAPVETLERFFDLRVKVKAEIAKEEFTKALAKFQEECPVIKKTKVVFNKDGSSVRYKFAPLDSISEQIRKPLKDAEMTYSWNVELKDGHMSVTCKITHILGHFDVSTLDIPIDKDGFMTAPQKYASAQTFAKRYTLLNVLGITTADEDDDSLSTSKERGALNPKAKIMFLLRELKEDTSSADACAKSVRKITTLELVEKNYPTIIERLEAQVKENHEGN